MRGKCLVLFHGTTVEGAESLLRSPFATDGELWLANDSGLARAYGKVVLAVTVPQEAILDAYPLRTGTLEQVEDYFNEPIEFLMRFDKAVQIRILPEGE